MSITFPEQKELESQISNQKKILCTLASQVHKANDAEMTKKLEKYFLTLYDKSTISLKRNIVLASVRPKIISLFEKVINEEESKVLLGMACQHLLKVLNTEEMGEKEKGLIQKALFDVPIVISKVIIIQILSNKMTKLADSLFGMVLERLGEFQATKLLTIVSKEMYDKHKKQHLECALTRQTGKVILGLINRDLDYILTYLGAKIAKVHDRYAERILDKYKVFFRLLQTNSPKKFLQFFFDHTPNDKFVLSMFWKQNYLAKREPELLLKYLLRPEYLNKCIDNWDSYKNKFCKSLLRAVTFEQRKEIAKVHIKYGSNADYCAFIIRCPNNEHYKLFHLNEKLANSVIEWYYLDGFSNALRFEQSPRVFALDSVQKLTDDIIKNKYLRTGDISVIREELMEVIKSAPDSDFRATYTQDLIFCSIKSRKQEELTKTLKWISVRSKNDQGPVREKIIQTIFSTLSLQYLTENDIESLKDMFIDAVEARDTTSNTISQLQELFYKILEYHVIQIEKLKAKEKIEEEDNISAKWIDMIQEVFTFAWKNEKWQRMYRYFFNNRDKKTKIFLFNLFYKLALLDVKKLNFSSLFQIIGWDSKLFLKSSELNLEQDLIKIITQYHKDKDSYSGTSLELINFYLSNPRNRSEKIQSLFKNLNDNSLITISAVNNHVIKHLPELLIEKNVFDNDGIISGKYLGAQALKIYSLKKLQENQSICYYLIKNPRVLRSLDSNLQKKYLSNILQIINKKSDIKKKENEMEIEKKKNGANKIRIQIQIQILMLLKKVFLNNILKKFSLQ
ncbi:hypothetical protein M0813_24886 [Anaeramoeba flamelloides]|uniref:Uncharacterized protein n=1 Tax=Anaeramoeba flamelloides TaxID=1746091 RepID=A0ABQ8Y4B0_9EUKA|nr:hypothetical protein M0813_24886 [Anaeramoeba flamelloides]